MKMNRIQFQAGQGWPRQRTQGKLRRNRRDVDDGVTESPPLRHKY